MGFLGHHHTKEVRERISISHLEKGNGAWKGNDVGYVSLHLWVRSRLPKPEYCQCCNKNKPYDLANKGEYDRNLENWEWLCRSCHMKKDGRINRLLNVAHSTKRNRNNNGRYV